MGTRYHQTILILILFFFLPICSAEEDNYTHYESYSDMIDWESVPDQTQSSNIVGHYYSWDHDLNKYKNAIIYNDPVFWDLPADTILNSITGPSPFQWTYLRILNPKYAVRYNNLTYTNSSDVVYEVGYLEKTSKKMSNRYIDNISFSEAEIINNTILVTVTCEWHTSEHSKTSGIKKVYFITTIHKSTLMNNDYNRWVTEDEYNETVECVITNHSGFYSTISMTGLPTNVSYYNISVKMGNVTKYMLKSSYVYFKNETVDYQLYDMYDYDYYDLHGISPYGKDCFLVPKGDIDSISIKVSTPFESYTLNTNVTRVDRGKYSTEGDITGAIMCLICVYILYRMLR
jgi:hypothetical protein